MNNLIDQMISTLTSYLDSLGAQTWSLRTVALMSAVVCLGIRITLGKKRGIDWDALIHAIISGVGSSICVYIDAKLPNEPLSTLQCNGSVTGLHRILPAITQGYAICDIINGVSSGPVFVAHGIATFFVMGFFNELDASAIVMPTLVMEVSTIILCVLKADFLTPVMQVILQALFTFLFFLCRIVIVPYLYFKCTLLMYHSLGSCFPRYIFYVTVVFGVFFHGLNAFWFYKIVLKIQRKLSGKESIGNADKTQ